MNAHDEIEFVTVQQSMAYEQHRFEPITAEDVRMAARSLGGEAGFFDFHGEWSSASEILNLMARYLTGRAFLPEDVYKRQIREHRFLFGSITGLKSVPFGKSVQTRRLMVIPVNKKIQSR